MIVRNHLALSPWRLFLFDSSYTIAPYLIHMMLHGLYVLGSSAHCVWPDLSCLPSLGSNSGSSSGCVPIVDLTTDPDVSLDGAYHDVNRSDDSHSVTSPSLLDSAESCAASSNVISPPPQSSSSVTYSRSSPSSAIISSGVSVDSTSPLQSTPSSGDPSSGPPLDPPPSSPPLSSPCYSPSSSLDLTEVYLNIFSPPMHERPSPSPLPLSDSMSFYEPSFSLSPFDPAILTGWSPEPTYRLDPYLDMD